MRVQYIYIREREIREERRATAAAADALQGKKKKRAGPRALVQSKHASIERRRRRRGFSLELSSPYAARARMLGTARLIRQHVRERERASYSAFFLFCGVFIAVCLCVLLLLPLFCGGGGMPRAAELGFICRLHSYRSYTPPRQTLAAAAAAGRTRILSGL